MSDPNEEERKQQEHEELEEEWGVKFGPPPPGWGAGWNENEDSGTFSDGE